MGAAVSALTSCAGSCVGAATCTGCNACMQAVGAASPKLGYSVLFLLAVLLNVLLREQGASLLSLLPNQEHAAHDSLHAALRASTAPVALFGSLAFTLLGTGSRASFRFKQVHAGLWMVKALVLIGLTAVFVCCLPDQALALYVPLARALGAVFLVLQMVILVDFAYEWSESWASREDDRWFIALLAFTLAFYAASITLHALMLVWFNPDTTETPCRLNLALGSISLICTLALVPLSMLPSAREGALFPSSIVSLYAAFTLYTALSSAPDSSMCKPSWLKSDSAGSEHAPGLFATAAAHSAPEVEDDAHSGRPGGLTGALVTYSHLLFTCLCVLYSVSKAGTSGVLVSAATAEDELPGEESEELLPRSRSAGEAPMNDEEDEEEATPGVVGSGSMVGSNAEAAERENAPDYSPSLFHSVFTCAFAYVAMLLTDWGTSSLEQGQHSIGWSSFAAKSIATFAIIGLHGWTVIAPAVFPNRSF